MKNVCYVLLLFCLGSCATIIEGSKQTVYVNSAPSGANLSVNGRTISKQTPCQIEIDRKETYNGRHIINYTFEKEGYQKKVFEDKSKINPLSIAGCLVFTIYNFWDWYSGAAYKYSSNIFVTLEPQVDLAENIYYRENQVNGLSFSTLVYKKSSFSLSIYDSISYFNRTIKPNNGQKILSVNLNLRNSTNENTNVKTDKILLSGNNNSYPLLGIGTQSYKKSNNDVLDYIINSELIQDFFYNNYGYFHIKGQETGEFSLACSEESSYLKFIKTPCSIKLYFVISDDCKQLELLNFFKQPLHIDL